MKISKEIKNIINELEKIALNKDILESAEQHIDLLIEVEKSEQKPGWRNRIEEFNILKKQKKQLREKYNGEHEDIKKIQDFLKRFDKEEMKKI